MIWNKNLYLRKGTRQLQIYEYNHLIYTPNLQKQTRPTSKTAISTYLHNKNLFYIYTHNPSLPPNVFFFSLLPRHTHRLWVSCYPVIASQFPFRTASVGTWTYPEAATFDYSPGTATRMDSPWWHPCNYMRSPGHLRSPTLSTWAHSVPRMWTPATRRDQSSSSPCAISVLNQTCQSRRNHSRFPSPMTGLAAEP